jgi:hypothetical protein
MPRCKNCKDKFEPVRFNQKFCLKDECIKAFVEDVKQKEWKKTKAKLKNDLKTTTDWLKEAQKVFNTFVRLRDQGKPCVSCGGSLGEKYDAGHYFSMGGHKAVTFNEDNVHAQCVTCNRYKHGNLLEYQIGIEKRIGPERLLELHEKAHETRKYTPDELKYIIHTYKEKIKILQKNSLN